MIEKKTNQEGLILHVKSKATVSLEDMLNGLKYIQKDSDLPKKLRIFEDATNSKITFREEDIDILVKNMNETAKGFNMIRHAVLHDSPKNTALTVLIEQRKINKNYMLRIFSTKEGAHNWLNS